MSKKTNLRRKDGRVCSIRGVDVDNNTAGAPFDKSTYYLMCGDSEKQRAGEKRRTNATFTCLACIAIGTS